MIKFIQRLYYFFFCPEKFEEETYRRLESECPKDTKNNLKKNYRELRKHVFRAGKFVLSVVVVTLLIYFIFLFFKICVPHTALIILRLIGYCLVLWGVLSHLGYPIKTFGGETLPEIFDEEWYKFSYLGGLFFLLLSYLLEI